MRNDIKVVDFFCGIGGLTHGLRKAKLNVVAGVDSDGSCKFAYEANNKGARFIEKPIENIQTREIKDLLKGAEWKIFVGCAPCQPFSSYNLKMRRYVKNKGPWNLINVFMEKIKEVEPDIVSMENVPQLASQDVFRKFIKQLDENGYYRQHKILNCADYGIPQSRRRLVLLASRYSEIKWIPPTGKRKTLKDVIGRMSKLSHGERHNRDRLHVSARLKEINLKRIEKSSPGGTWLDWPQSLRPECYKKPSGQTYKNVYGRMLWELPAPTITGQFYRYGTGRFGHPEQDRALSLREGSRIQTFPNDYKFVPRGQKICMRTIGMHIGNAVPVDLGEMIGKTILAHIKEVNNHAI